MIVTVALALPVLGMLVAGSVELVEVANAQNKLQVYVDTAALAGARQLATDGSSATTERTRVTADGLADPLRQRWTVTTTARADLAAGSMTVTQAATRPSLFGNLVPPGGFNISASATASSTTAMTPLCVLALQSGGSNVVRLADSAMLTASTCLVQSDGDLAATGSSKVQAGAIRSVGAATGSLAPAPVTDAPAIPDPFASMAITVPPGCSDLLTLELPGGTTTLNPGVHCGVLNLVGGGTLMLNPGEHYFTGGVFNVLGTTKIVGTDVVMILKGPLAVQFAENSTLSLEGRKTGPYAGFALITDRSFTGALSISTRYAQKLLGTIYVPNGTVAVSGDASKVADQSAWTIVVAKALSVAGSANLVINSSYASSTIPVPTGVGPGSLRLAR